MNREVLDGWCERGILGLALAILVFGPLATGAVGTLEFLVLQGLTLGVLLLWGARFWLNGRPQLLWPPICWAVAAFTLYAIIRYLAADVEYTARQELIRVLVYAFLFLAVINNLHRQESVQVICVTLVFLAMAIAFYAVYQFLANSDRVWNLIKPYPHRGSGTYISPNHLGGFLEQLLPLALGYAMLSRLKPVAKVFMGYAAVVILAGIAVTVSRGSWMATGLSLVLFFGVLLFHRAHRLPSVALLGVIALGCVLVLPQSFSMRLRFKQLFVHGRVNDDFRFALWQPAFRMWQDNPWWGAGPAHFNIRFRQYRPEEVQMQPDRAHNDYLNTLADWGLVGAGLVASAWVLLGLGVVKTWGFVRGTASDLGGKKSSTKFAFVLGTSTGLAALLFHSALDFNMHIPANAILAVTLMALLSSHLRFATERYWLRLGFAGKLLASGLLLAGAIYLAYQGSRRAQEYVWLERARHAPTFSAQQAGFLARAFAAEPMNWETALAAGDAYRIQSKDGGTDYRELARQAMDWYGRCMKLNRWNGYGFLHYGGCLDWVGRQAESALYFSKADELDPNNYNTANYIGLHYVELGDYAAARSWFERSQHLEWRENTTALSYLGIVNARLLEAATNTVSRRLNGL
jgi:O-antigen ligase